MHAALTAPPAQHEPLRSSNSTPPPAKSASCRSCSTPRPRTARTPPTTRRQASMPGARACCPPCRTSGAPPPEPATARARAPPAPRRPTAIGCDRPASSMPTGTPASASPCAGHRWRRTRRTGACNAPAPATPPPPCTTKPRHPLPGFRQWLRARGQEPGRRSARRWGSASRRLLSHKCAGRNKPATLPDPMHHAASIHLRATRWP